MDKINTDITEAFLRLWDGYEKRHLELSAKGVTKDDKGKVNAKATTTEGPITPELVWAHLSAEASIGVAPVKADSTCLWGVLDIDWCDMPEDDVRAVADKVRTKCAAFRSKSRGLHVYFFCSEPVPARRMHEYLVAIRKRLPKKVAATTEIFPKATQVIVAPDNEPSAVNLPLRGQQRELAWAVSDDGLRWAKRRAELCIMIDLDPDLVRAEIISILEGATPRTNIGNGLEHARALWVEKNLPRPQPRKRTRETRAPAREAAEPSSKAAPSPIRETIKAARAWLTPPPAPEDAWLYEAIPLPPD